MTESLELAWEMVRRHPRTAARTLEELPASHVAAFLKETPAQLGALVLSRMTLPSAARVVQPLETEDAAGVLRGAPSPVAAGVVRHLGEPRRSQILDRLPPKTARACGLLLDHPEDTVGGWMEPRVHVLPHDVTVDGAIRRLQEADERKSARLYVVDRSHRLKGTLDMWDLVNSGRGTDVSSLMERGPRTLSARTRLTAVYDHPAWNDLNELPIIAADGSFLGVLRHAELTRALRAQFPETGGAGFDDVALELTSDVWRGLWDFLETMAGMARPSEGSDEGHKP